MRTVFGGHGRRSKSVKERGGIAGRDYDKSRQIASDVVGNPGGGVSESTFR